MIWSHVIPNVVILDVSTMKLHTDTGTHTDTDTDTQACKHNHASALS